MEKFERKIKKAISGEDIMNIMKGKCRVLNYNNLTNYDNIEDAFYPHKVIFLLFETKKNFGHWCVLLDRGESIEHFDPYGIFPDKELKFTDDSFREKNNMDLPHLTRLLYNSPKKIEYNDHKLQGRGENINNCGRWCILRAMWKDIPIDDFAKYFKSNKHFDKDELATLLTYDI